MRQKYGRNTSYKEEALAEGHRNGYVTTGLRGVDNLPSCKTCFGTYKRTEKSKSNSGLGDLCLLGLVALFLGVRS